MNSQFLLAAAHSGSGKTTATLGLLRALLRKGYRVQPYKCGPDFIDPVHHQTASGQPGINLDRFLMSDDHIRALYGRYGATADIRITEGVMGLFDGVHKSEGSSADIAKLLDLPVIIILDAEAMAYTAAAVLYGLKNFDPLVRIAGVIFNYVDSSGHYQLLREACADIDITPLGHLPANPQLHIPSRHLGLDTASAERAINAAADHIEKYIDLELLLSMTASTPLAPAPYPPPTTQSKKILIARDAAFHFLYEENIRQLAQWGEISYFSPLASSSLPFIPDLLYLPGGYPEFYLPELSGNQTLLAEISTYSTHGRIIAECGGMMYLGKAITDNAGRSWPMADVLDISTSMHQQKLTIGYRTMQLGEYSMKGHEFHFSQPLGECTGTPIFHTRHILASYAHFYWGENTDWLKTFLS